MFALCITSLCLVEMNLVVSRVTLISSCEVKILPASAFKPHAYNCDPWTPGN